MVYLEIEDSKFWRCEVEETTVWTSYGKIGNTGRKLKKEFSSEEDARKYQAKQEASKRKAGYADGIVEEAPQEEEEENTLTGPAPTKKRASPCSDQTPNQKKSSPASYPTTIQKGLSGHAAPPDILESPETNEIDPGVAGIDANLVSRGATLHGTHHARLLLVEPAQNSDKYYFLQILVVVGEKEQQQIRAPAKKKRKMMTRKKDPKPNAAAAPAQYYVFTRWGRTGTSGTAKLDGPFQEEQEAKSSFEKIFQAKTGVAWNEASPGCTGELPVDGKYEYLAPLCVERAFVDSRGTWYYYLKDDPLGKADGWYRYDDDNSQEVEELYVTFMANRQSVRLSRRVVTSESNGFEYHVNLRTMEQTNASSGTTRPIARTEDETAPTTVPTIAVRRGTPIKRTSAPRAIQSPTAIRSRSEFRVAGTVDAVASPSLQNGTVLHDVMLNQTNIANNNNKFYKIQLIQAGASFTVLTRWGRVGENGQKQELGPFLDASLGTKEFGKKFRSKTGNKWEDYQADASSFVSKKGKYTVVEMERDEEAAEAMRTAATEAGEDITIRPPKPVTVAPSALDVSTKGLVDLIFDKDMFHCAMSAMNIDPRKLPLGALSPTQIAKGYTVLESLEDAIKAGANNNEIMELTSEFYTIIPHAFGRQRGPILRSASDVQAKFDMLNILSDIEVAQAMQKEKKQKEESTVAEQEELLPNPSDLHYNQLLTDLSLLDPTKDDDYKTIEVYFNDTKRSSGHRGGMSLDKIWRVNRHGEDARFATHESLGNRQLLWHGTNVAVVAAILKSGLRIMPHSGGRVGRGIYLADQHEKSAWYTQSAQGTTIMFLVEAVLGKSHEILSDDPSLVRAPDGYESVLAKGRRQPSSSVEMTIDGKPVTVPQGAPAEVIGAETSRFEHNEFLIYKESQHRIRYVITFRNC
mmetsp:Transcript_55329/g.83735  ORF Transcript_55329/g.83735 Transcript_55329/m.83735 type:complete len:918 (-) Transcript_55329:210-2963(-)